MSIDFGIIDWSQPPQAAAGLITTHVIDAQARLTAQFQKPQLQALVAIAATRTQGLENMLWSILGTTDSRVATNSGKISRFFQDDSGYQLAVGGMLTNWGLALGIPRPKIGTGATYDTITITPSVPLVTGNLTSGTVTATTINNGLTSSTTAVIGPVADLTSLAGAIQSAVPGSVVSAASNGSAITVGVAAGVYLEISNLTTIGGTTQPTWSASETIDDSAYFKMVLAQVVVNNSIGRTEDLIAILRDLGGSSIICVEPGNYGVQMTYSGTLALTSQQVAVMISEAATPASVGIIQRASNTPVAQCDTSGAGCDQGYLSNAII